MFYNEMCQCLEDLQDYMKLCFLNNQRKRSYKHEKEAFNTQDGLTGTDMVSYSTLQLAS